MAGGSTFRVSPEDVSRSIEAIMSKMQEFTMESDKLYSEAETLATQWKGATSDAFNADLGSYKEVIVRMYNSLVEYCNGVGSAMQTYTTVDSSLADEVRTTLGTSRKV